MESLIQTSSQNPSDAIAFGQMFVHDDFLPRTHYQELLQNLKNTPMLFGWKNHGKTIREFWHKNYVLPGTYNHHYSAAAVNQNMDYQNFLQNSPPALALAAEKIRRELFKGVEFTRLWLNVQNFGDEGDPHRDFPMEFKETARAAILYLQETWDPAWGGDFAIFSDTSEIDRAVCIRPNRLVLFNGCQTHAARPISRFCTEPRRALVFACEKV